MRYLTYTVLLICVLPSQATVVEQWQAWKEEFGKVYRGPQEEARALAVWSRNLEYIQSHNNRADVTFTLTMNQFGDQVPRSLSRGEHTLPLRFAARRVTNHLPQDTVEEFDWRDHGVISAVKDQGRQGSAGAFPVAEDVESFHAIKSGQLYNLSATEVADCCFRTPGLLVSGVFECIAKLGGLCLDRDYISGTGPNKCNSASCTAVPDEAKTTILINSGDEQEMMTAILKTPLVVAIDASRPSFQFYSGGVYDDPDCSTTMPDHALQVVGFSVVDQTPAWIARNSWGSSWGMNGYILIKRGVNMCGIASNAFYPGP